MKRIAAVTNPDDARAMPMASTRLNVRILIDTYILSVKSCTGTYEEILAGNRRGAGGANFDDEINEREM